MSDTPPEKPAAPAGPETQKQRWMKYGSNVAAMCVIAVVAGAFVIVSAQQPDAKVRIDTTQSGLYSLKPQTKAILKDVKENVRIVSLYTKTKPPEGEERKDYVDRGKAVADLLDEYKRNSGGKIDVEVIDPTENQTKVDDLIASVSERYGGEVKKYRDFLDGYAGKDKTEEQLRKLLTDEVKHASALGEADVQGSELGEVVQDARSTAGTFIRLLDKIKKGRDAQLATKPPDYKGAVQNIETTIGSLSANAAKILGWFEQFKDAKGDSEPAKKYAAEAKPRFEAIKKQADAVTDTVKKLGDLKLDKLGEQLGARNGILVMGPRDMKVITEEQVWQEDPNVRRQLSDPSAKVKPRFAGEQQVTSAILALTQEKKPKVAFVRPGGGPLTQSGGFFGPSGPFSLIAARLREYNFDVVEKDLSGMWAMQQQMQQRGMPPEPEPSDEEIKDAIWVVLSIPTGPSQMGPPPSIASKVQEHLARGGSALLLYYPSPQTDNLDSAIGEWGLKVRTDAMAVHEPVPDNGAPTTDIVELARRQPPTFVLNQYGEHMLAKPLNSLDTVMLGLAPVTITEEKKGYKYSRSFPLPQDPPSWGETNIESVTENGTVKFEKDSDISGPLFGGTAVEKEGGGRVVAIGSVQFLLNDLITYLDRELLARDVYAFRFPGSAELFMNSVFWLAKMEPMIAISPAAMEVSRIQPMSAGGQWFWRTGVLLIALPLLVILAGGLMYLRRRD